MLQKDGRPENGNPLILNAASSGGSDSYSSSVKSDTMAEPSPSRIFYGLYKCRLDKGRKIQKSVCFD
jgi:hypothetical protein